MATTYTPHTTRPLIRAVALSLSLLAVTVSVGGNLGLAAHYAAAAPIAGAAPMVATRTGTGLCVRA